MMPRPDIICALAISVLAAAVVLAVPALARQQEEEMRGMACADFIEMNERSPEQAAAFATGFSFIAYACRRDIVERPPAIIPFYMDLLHYCQQHSSQLLTDVAKRACR